MLASIVAGAAAAGAAVTGAVYVNFSTRVMPRLAALPDSEGIATMQQFNRNAVQPPFMLAFFGAAAASTALIVRAIRADRRTIADWVSVGGAGLYLAGFVLTIAYNVPRNDRLASVDAASSAAVAVWRDYVTQWTAANSVRGAMSALSAAALLYSAVVFARES